MIFFFATPIISIPIFVSSLMNIYALLGLLPCLLQDKYNLYRMLFHIISFIGCTHSTIDHKTIIEPKKRIKDTQIDLRIGISENKPTLFYLVSRNIESPKNQKIEEKDVILENENSERKNLRQVNTETQNHSTIHKTVVKLFDQNKNTILGIKKHNVLIQSKHELEKHPSGHNDLQKKIHTHWIETNPSVDEVFNSDTSKSDTDSDSLLSIKNLFVNHEKTKDNKIKEVNSFMKWFFHNEIPSDIYIAIYEHFGRDILKMAIFLSHAILHTSGLTKMVAPGDGAYKPRGLVHIIGKENYRKLGEPFVSNPDKLGELSRDAVLASLTVYDPQKHLDISAYPHDSPYYQEPMGFYSSEWIKNEHQHRIERWQRIYRYICCKMGISSQVYWDTLPKVLPNLRDNDEVRQHST